MGDPGLTYFITHFQNYSRLSIFDSTLLTVDEFHLKKSLLLILFLFLFYPKSVYPQDFSISKIEPPNWWIGMKWSQVQLMVYGKNLGNINVSSSSQGLVVKDILSTENKGYLFINLLIDESISPGNYDLIFIKNDDTLQYSYPLLSREFKPPDHKGFSNEDVIYLIFADRFCDGNPANNTIGDSLDQFTSADIDGRKGGDIKGIISKLDYLRELGITAIWVTPMLENNMWMSYHGYAATDLYKIDPRFGSNKLYKQMIDEAHQRGIKVILDHVSNHIGINHPWIKNLPSPDWINGTVNDHLSAMHDKMAFLDIHGDSIIVDYTQKGWFTDYMPDLNQKNPFLKKYLIQNTLWWIEFSGLDGVREDTYPYSNQEFLSQWAKAILNEYPDANIVGEIWQGVPSIISGYQTNSPVRKISFDSNLPSVTDFALSDAIRNYLSGEKNIFPVYEALTQDIVYSDPDNLLVFMDNHDISRAMFVANGNVDRFKIGLNLVLYTRGIPVLLYGTEIGIKGGKADGELREPFPGGFEYDKRNAFTSEGRTETENEIFNYLNKLLQLRKNYPVLEKGKMTHIYTGGDIYMLIKTLGEETALLILNTGEKEQSFQISQLNKFLPKQNKMENIKTSEEIDLNSEDLLKLKGFETEIYFFKK